MPQPLGVHESVRPGNSDGYVEVWWTQENSFKTVSIRVSLAKVNDLEFAATLARTRTMLHEKWEIEWHEEITSAKHA